MKVEQLPGQNTTPEVFCARLLEYAAQGKIVHIACVIQWSDETTNTAHTAMTNTQRAWMTAVFNDQFKVFE